jgi:UDP-N-acetylglucosamine transferase subunit ALG13
VREGVAEPDVLVLVGTDAHPFDRMVAWVDSWLSSRADPLTCLIQYGTSSPPRVATAEAYLDHASVQELMRRAAVVVMHGGPTTISEARRFGHRPIVVPRVPGLGEHVDDHQVRFTARLDDAGLIDLVGSADALSRAIEDTLRSGGPRTQDGDDAESTRAAIAFGEVVDTVLQASGRSGGTKRRGLLRSAH